MIATVGLRDLDDGRRMVAVIARRSFGTGRVVALAVTALSLAGLGFAVAARCAIAKGDSLALELLGDLPFAGFVLVGLLVVAARPANRVGWWMLSGGVCSALGSAGVALAEHGILVDPGSVPGVPALAITGQGLRGLGWAVLTLVVPALFPDGRVKDARWRWMYPALAAVLVASVLDPLLDPQADLTDVGSWRNPVAPPGAGQILSLPVFLAHIPLSAVLTVAAVVQLVQRWRAGGELLRQQLLLFAAGAALAAVAAPAAIWIGGGGWVFSVGTALMPVAIGFAVLARGLYDLRSATNRTLVWLTLSVCVAAVLALVISLGTLAEVDTSTPWLSWLAAGVAAACFAPLRDLMQRGVNRITYGRWTEPYELLAMLGKQVEASVDVDRLLMVVQSELEALGLRDVRVTSADEQTVDASGEMVAVPLSAYGLLVGTLAYREPDPPLRARDRRLIEDLAGHLGGVLHARMLMQDLQRARERLVLGREEERRRLRRDLHDGLGPALAGHLLRLDVIAGRVGADAEASRLVDSLREELRDTVQDVRRLVEGLRPPALDELGLVGALRQAGSRLAGGAQVRVVIRAEQLPALPAGVEVAAYRIATEAMTNVVKHADARNCVVDIDVEQTALIVRVHDDGRGLERDAGLGHGLRTMRERAEELRGSLTIAAVEEGGTALVARLPLSATSLAAPQPAEVSP
jgi:signal transduction histidine kinase